MTIKKWDIWWAIVEYEHHEGFKRRPVLVISPEECYVLGCKITSHEARDQWGEYEIIYWKSAGLPKPSTVRLTQIMQMDKTMFKSKLGQLHPYDIERIEQMII